MTDTWDSSPPSPIPGAPQVWNEARDFGSEYAFQMHDMAKRDRNHASVIINSLWCVGAAAGSTQQLGKKGLCTHPAGRSPSWSASSVTLSPRVVQQRGRV